MIIVVKPGSTQEQVQEILDQLDAHGLKAHVSEGSERMIIGVIGDKSLLSLDALEVLPAVEKLVPIMESYKLASKAFRPQGTSFEIKDVTIGGKELVMMAGPCAVESEEQVETVAAQVRACGARFLRGGAYKPRTSPYAFQGLEKEGLQILRRVADRHGLLVISEITSENDIAFAADYVDMADIIEDISAYNNSADAIGYSVYYYAKNMYTQPGLKFIAVDGVVPSNETINSREYGFTNPFYGVIPLEPNPQAEAILTWLLTDDGQQMLEDCGYVPIRQID